MSMSSGIQAPPSVVSLDSEPPKPAEGRIGAVVTVEPLSVRQAGMRPDATGPGMRPDATGPWPRLTEAGHADPDAAACGTRRRKPG